MIAFPARLYPFDAKLEIRAPKALGITASVYLHEIARKLPIYHQPIECEAVGKDGEDAEIKIKTVGRWLFGVPGFDGHLRIVPNGTNVTLYYPGSAPQLAQVLVHVLKQTIEGEEGPNRG